MKVLITSDAHDRWDFLEQAVNQGNVANCEVMLFAGDLISPTGITIMENFNGKVHFVLGNNEGELVKLTRMSDASKNIALHYEYGQSVFDEKIDELSFYMNHYPTFVHNAAQTGKYDVCVYGHDHMYHTEILPNGTLVLNPGALKGDKEGQVTCMIFDTKDKSVQKIELTSI